MINHRFQMIDLFQVLSVDGSKQVGTITKKWSGFIKEAFTDADNFGIQFPMDLDVTVKATLLGALFLIVCTVPYDTQVPLYLQVLIRVSSRRLLAASPRFSTFPKNNMQ